MQLRQVSPWGNPELDVPLLRRVLVAGEEFDVTEDQARALLLQRINFEPVDGEAQAIADEIDEELKAAEDPDEPARNARKPAWVGWAIRQGADPAAAQKLTIQQLQDQYGKGE